MNILWYSSTLAVQPARLRLACVKLVVAAELGLELRVAVQPRSAAKPGQRGEGVDILPIQDDPQIDGKAAPRAPSIPWTIRSKVGPPPLQRTPAVVDRPTPSRVTWISRIEAFSSIPRYSVR